MKITIEASSVEDLRNLLANLIQGGKAAEPEPAKEPTKTLDFNDAPVQPVGGFEQPAPVANVAKRRGRPPKAVEPKVEAEAAPARAGPENPSAFDEPEPEEPEETPREQLIKALNDFATARGDAGQKAARTLMQAVCGATRLLEIKPEDYGKLLKALKEAPPPRPTAA
jgi:hypothetical protein